MDRHTTKETVDSRIGSVVRTLGMSAMMNTRLSFLSGGERKKVALAVQLINDPPILFCDEITTGLDSYSAAHIVNTLKCVSRTGKIVVCTIHQPASGVFDKFDEIVLLSNGRLAYQGPVTAVNRLYEKYLNSVMISFDLLSKRRFQQANIIMRVFIGFITNVPICTTRRTS